MDAFIIWHERVMSMYEPVIYPATDSTVMHYAVEAMRWRGIMIADTYSAEVTHILLPIPQASLPEELTDQLHPHITVIGGNLDLPQYRCMDLLKDDLYLSKNAMITAQIATTLAAQHLPIVLDGCPVLILGWGRIGKCLMKLLTGLGADVTVAVRKPSDRGIITALGCQAADICNLNHTLRRYRVIFNTIPHPILDDERRYRSDCIKIELASQPGIAGTDVIQARGLPGKYAPESSGKLIAQTVQRLLIHEEVRQ